MRTQRPLILAVALAYVVGLGGLLLSPADGTLSGWPPSAWPRAAGSPWP